MLYDHSTGVASVANTGDTRAVISRLGTALDITRDMKATDPMEVARIVKGGGHIANGRVLGSLAIARALGDKNLKDSPTKSIIPDPEVTSFSVTADDEFIVIATDGLWDVMSSQVSRSIQYTIRISLVFLLLLLDHIGISDCFFVSAEVLCVSFVIMALTHSLTQAVVDMVSAELASSPLSSSEFDIFLTNLPCLK